MPQMTFTPFEPRQTFRFIMIAPFMQGQDFLIKTAGLPKLSQGRVTIDYINVDFHVKGKSRWNELDITIYDLYPNQTGGGVSTAWLIHDYLKTYHHNSETGVDGWAFSDYKQDIDLKYVDPKGGEPETWKLHGSFITDIDWGAFDWSDDGTPLEVNCTISYDYAVLQ